MRLIRVTYRATFHGLKTGPLNQIGFQLPCAVAVEVYPTPNGKWWARTPAIWHESSSGAVVALNPPWPLLAAPNPEIMRRDVAAQFETQLTPWEMWGNPGPAYGVDRPRLLQPDEVEVRENGQVYFKG